MNSDRLINLLPDEYLPEPEFRAFPFFAAGLIILTVVWLYIQFITLDGSAKNLIRERDDLTRTNEKRFEQVAGFVDVQAGARYISSYAAVIPNMVLAAPDYWEIYNEIERLLPEDTWVTEIKFVAVKGRWPDVQMDCVTRGYSFLGPLNTIDALMGDSENQTRFVDVKTTGYKRENVNGVPGVMFEITMAVKYPMFEDLQE